MACVSWAGTGDPPPCARAPGASAWASSRNHAHLRCAGPSEGDARRPRRGRRAPGRQPGRCPARMSAPPLGRRRALREICMRWLGRFALEHSQRPVGASARPTESRSEGPASRTQSRAVGRTALCGRVVSAFAWLRLWRRSSSRARSTCSFPMKGGVSGCPKADRSALRYTRSSKGGSWSVRPTETGRYAWEPWHYGTALGVYLVRAPRRGSSSHAYSSSRKATNRRDVWSTPIASVAFSVSGSCARRGCDEAPRALVHLAPQLPWPANVWMGVTIENRRFVHRADALRAAGVLGT
jgi:hypothetical protein